MNPIETRQQRRRLRKAAVAVGAALALAIPSVTLATGTLDQQQTSYGQSKALIGTEETGPDVRQAQVFMAGISGALDQVDLPVRAVGDPGVPLLVEIRALDGSG